MSMFDIHNLNIIQDDENYYFFRALTITFLEHSIWVMKMI